jgi:PTS system fructose-specific IIC component
MIFKSFKKYSPLVYFFIYMIIKVKEELIMNDQDNKVFKKEYIFLDTDLKTQAETFKFIAQKAVALKIVSSETALIQGFKKREAEGSTGFEDGFAIPHARIKEVKQAAVFVIRFKNEVD